MKSGLKKTMQKSIAILLIAISIFGLLDIGNFITYAYTADDGMIYCPYESMVETKKTADPNGVKANGLVHGKTLRIMGETTGTDGKLWYQVQYYTGTNGTTSNTAYCPAEKVRLNKDAVATSTGKVNADTELWSCTESYKKPLLATIPNNTKVYITDTKSDNGSWYRIYCDINGVRTYGWIVSSGVTIDAVPDLPTDATYEEQLRQAGFPESYIKPLAVLHERYPNWIFKPIQTGLDWNTVVAEEAKGDRNLVSKDADDSKKSTTSEDYDWYTNKWTIRDGSGWVGAGSDYIAWCMDPRNFFDAQNIFMFEQLDSDVVLDAAGVATIIDGTFMENPVLDTNGEMLDYAAAFVDIGNATGINAYHLAVRVRQEQGTKGISSLISGTYPGYEGYFNYFNVGAYGTPASVLIQRGLEKAVEQGWNTRYASLEGGALFLKDRYIGIGQNTLYFQKFNVVYASKLYDHQYMQNVDGARSEAMTMARAHQDLEKSLVFAIPVYLNMPEKPVTFVESGNPNNYLSSLTISGVPLTPGFDGARTEYTAIVDASVNSVSVKASAVASTSKVRGTGTYNLSTGTNTITVTCTAENGDAKTYTVTIVKEEMSSGEYSIISDKYTMGDTITGVASGTTTADFLNGFQYNGCTIAVVGSDGSAKEGVVKTGDRLAVYVNDVLVQVNDIIVKGDINGDGNITIADLVRLNRHILGISSLSGIQQTAADVNLNGSVNIQDLVLMNRHILGIAEIN